MGWWAWMIGGVILFGAELAFIDAQFYLVFVGSAAIVVGLLVASVSIEPWAQWALFAVLSIASMALFRGRIYRRLRGHPQEVRAGPSGGVLALPIALAPGECCQTEHAGSFWTVRNDSTAPLPAGTRVRVVRVQGLTLGVHPAG
ncbi:MAG TPA: NfeD family protein [Steroidobacteraceae bacterium]|nr:NfeD family protein [Steroidobacteraceae bacterium]